MSKYRDYNHGDVFFASTLDAMMEATSTITSGLNLRIQNSTTIRAAASTDSGQVGVAINGLWRWRTSNFDAAHPSGSAGIYDVFATCSDNDFTGVGSDPDNTDYSWSLVILASGSTPTGVDQYRKVGECDWDGTKLTVVRQTVGSNSQTNPISPTANYASHIPVVVNLATSQSASAIEVRNSSGTTLASVSSAGTVTAPNVSVSAANGAEAIGITNRADLNFKDSSTTKATINITSGGVLQISDATTSRVTIASGNGDTRLKSAASSGSVIVGDTASEKVGFFGSSGAVRSSGWSVSNVSSDRAFDASSTTVNEIANALGTLVNDLKALGLIA